MKNSILIVEDNDKERFILKKMLESMGNEVLELENGKHLFNALDENQFNLIIIDWCLPYFTGGELIEMLRASPKYKTLPVILITRLSEEFVLEEALRLGANDFISKPFRASEIQCRIDITLKGLEEKEARDLKSNQFEELNKLIIGQNNNLKESLSLNDKLTSLKEQKLHEDLNYFRSETMNQAIRAASINEKMKHIIEEMEDLKRNIGNISGNDVFLDRINNTIKLIKKFEKSEFVWEEFSELFNHILDGFFSKLKQLNPSLSAIDLRVCAFIRMELDYLEIANILSIDPGNFKMKRYRLKKKLNIKKEQSLKAFLTSL